MADYTRPTFPVGVAVNHKYDWRYIIDKKVREIKSLPFAGPASVVLRPLFEIVEGGY